MTSHSHPPKPARSRLSRGLSGALAPSGDKSISHRALIFGALAEGETQIRGLLESDDVMRTARAMKALGAGTKRTSDGAWKVRGVGAAGLQEPAAALDFGNSGTGCRLTMGAAAGADIETRFIGDASLSSRPMERVLAPLRAFGAGAWCDDDRLPVRLKGRRPLHAITWISPAASAQVKSAVLIAALAAEGETEYVESQPTRDHTERMLALFGAPPEIESEGARRMIRLVGPAPLTSADVDVPGDPSSAAFMIAAAIVAPDSEVSVSPVLANTTRLGFFETLAEMGADMDFDEDPNPSYEPLAALKARTSTLKGIAVDPTRAPSMIDEFPILAVCAAYAKGATQVSGARELRIKESDRIAAIAAMLQANGVRVDVADDGFIVHGCGPGGVPGGGRVETHGDHRIAMSAMVLGLGAKQPVEIDDASMIATSYPGFMADMAAIGAHVDEVTA